MTEIRCESCNTQLAKQDGAAVIACRGGFTVKSHLGIVELRCRCGASKVINSFESNPKRRQPVDGITA